MANEKGQRISKFLADSGVASRRESENLISDGRITVNGEKILSPIFFVNGDEDIRVDGKKVAKQAPQLFIFNKPVGCICSTSDPEGRPTIYDVLPKMYRQLKYIGRLDYNTSGLLLMTNDGDLARKMTLPSSNVERTYIAKVGRSWTMDDKFVDRLLKPVRKGIKIEGIQYRPMKIERLDATNFKITIKEGKKNEIRIVFDHIGLPIRALHRISYGPYTLGNLQPKCIVNTKICNL